MNVAAEHAKAHFKLGVMYYTNNGAPQDDLQAVKWFSLAAEQGHDAAQATLGFMYSIGDGITQDFTMAVTWYMRAAKQGNTEAQFNLGRIYHLGQGVPQDNTLSHMWYNIASANGHDSAARMRDRLAGIMTGADLACAHSLADQCISSDYTVCEARHMGKMAGSGIQKYV